MTETTTITVEIPLQAEQQLAALARATGREQAQLTREAIERYLDIETWHLTKIRSAIAEADAGNFASDEEVAAVFARWTAR